MCEHCFCSQTKKIGDRNCTDCFTLANIFNQSTNKSLSKFEQKTFKDVARREDSGVRKRILILLTLKQADVRLEYKARVLFALPYSWPNINWIVP